VLLEPLHALPVVPLHVDAVGPPAGQDHVERGLVFGPRAHDQLANAAVRRLVPAIEETDLTPDLSGIRAKLQGPGEGFRDFVVAEESGRGCPGLVNLIGIDSPGLTSSLAIAAEVERLIA
jgi:L-2-hydroxyglutarate oxidase LhgO